MANNFTSNPIFLEDFTETISIKTALNLPSNAKLQLWSIIWRGATHVNHTALVTNGAGIVLFGETCTAAKDSLIQYYDGLLVSDIVVDAGRVSSGNLSIQLIDKDHILT